LAAFLLFPPWEEKEGKTPCATEKVVYHSCQYYYLAGFYTRPHLFVFTFFISSYIYIHFTPSYYVSPFSSSSSGWQQPSFMPPALFQEVVERFKVRADDLFVLTFPKVRRSADQPPSTPDLSLSDSQSLPFSLRVQCGTTMTQQILHLLVHKGEQPPQTMAEGVSWVGTMPPIGPTWPWSHPAFSSVTHRHATSQAATIPSPGAIQHRRHYGLRPAPGVLTLRQLRGGQIIHAPLPSSLLIVTRNPKDAMVSLWHHMRDKADILVDFKGDWDYFFEQVGLATQSRLSSRFRGACYEDPLYIHPMWPHNSPSLFRFGGSALSTTTSLLGTRSGMPCTRLAR
jgi:hypothetical protein